MNQRAITKLNDIPSLTASDGLMFIDEKNYELEIDTVNTNSSSFIRIGIKNSKFKGGSITNSIFEDVYAKKASFSNIDFTGTEFRNCNFEKASFYNCNFRYCKFQECLLPINEIIACLPAEPNLRKQIARRLKVNFNSMGDKRNADIFLDIEVNAEKKELIEIFKSKTSYYKQRYDIFDRSLALLKYFKYQSSSLIWGYGHRIDKLIKSYFIIIILFATIAFLTKTNFIDINTQVLRSLNFIESFLVLFSESIGYNFLSYTPVGTGGKILVFAIKFLGIIYLGLFVSSLFRKIDR